MIRVSDLCRVAATEIVVVYGFEMKWREKPEDEPKDAWQVNVKLKSGEVGRGHIFFDYASTVACIDAIDRQIGNVKTSEDESKPEKGPSDSSQPIVAQPFYTDDGEGGEWRTIE